MSFRFDYKKEGIDKLIDMVRFEIRQLQEQRFYQAVENITESHKRTLVQTLKQLRKTYLGEIKVGSLVVDKGVPRVEYTYVIGNDEVVKMTIHGSESGVVYLTSDAEYCAVVFQIEKRVKK